MIKVKTLILIAFLLLLFFVTFGIGHYLQADIYGTSLAAWWRLDNNDISGTTLTDRGPNAYNCILYNSVATGVPAKLSQGATFDGVNDTGGCGNGSQIQLAASGTISAWVKYSDGTTNYLTYVGKNNFLTDRNGYEMNTHSGKIGFELADNTGYSYMESTATWNDSKWHHVVGMWDGTNQWIYIDGKKAATSQAQRTPSSTLYALSLGSDGAATSTHLYKGSLDDVRIYRRGLSSNEIAQLYHQGLWSLILFGGF